MVATTIPQLHWRVLAHMVARTIDTALTALGQVWLDAAELRRGAPGPEGEPNRLNMDEEIQIMMALCGATFH